MRNRSAGRSVIDASGVLAVASSVGLFGLPLMFGSLPDPGLALLWLAVALVDGVCLLLPAPALARALASLLARLSARARASASSVQATSDVARLAVAAASLVLLQAIIRHPLVAVLGAGAEPFLVEALFGIFALVVLLVLLTWTYRAARPLIENVAWVALDATFATSVSEEAARAAATLAPVVTPTVGARPATLDATATRVR